MPLLTEKSHRIKTAKDHITNHVPFFPGKLLVSEGLELLHNAEKNFKNIEEIYIGENEVLMGIVHLSDLYTSSPSTTLSSLISNKKLITVGPATLPEKVAYIALQHECRSVPVVEKKTGKFLGVISSPSLLKILHTELREDILHLSGIHEHLSENEDDIFTTSIPRAVWSRFPWLLIGLLGGMFAAGMVNQFQEILSTNIILVAFIPLIANITDAVGTQMEAYTIRDMAMFRDINIVRYFFRQTSILSVIAVMLGLFMWGISMIFFHENFIIGVILFLSVIFASFSCLITGILLPFFFRKLHLDPANASGPIGTIIQDVLSIFIYFSIAKALL
ncbi:MAG: magnesium transporter [Candidatus Peregrinibacteria bacterium]